VSNLESVTTESIHPNPKDSAALNEGASPVWTEYDHAVSAMIQNVRIATYRKRRSYDFPWHRPGYMMQFQEIERAVLREVSRHFRGSLKELRLLDIGCGDRAWIRQFVKLGCPTRTDLLESMQWRNASQMLVTSRQRGHIDLRQCCESPICRRVLRPGGALRMPLHHDRQCHAHENGLRSTSGSKTQGRNPVLRFPLSTPRARRRTSSTRQAGD